MAAVTIAAANVCTQLSLINTLMNNMENHSETTTANATWNFLILRFYRCSHLFEDGLHESEYKQSFSAPWAHDEKPMLVVDQPLPYAKEALPYFVEDRDIIVKEITPTEITLQFQGNSIKLVPGQSIKLFHAGQTSISPETTLFAELIS